MDKIKEKPQTVSSIHEKIKAAPKELVHRGLEDGSDRLRTGLRDAAQQGRRDDYGGDQIEDTVAGGMRRMERGAEKLIKEKGKNRTGRSGSSADPAAGDPVQEVRAQNRESRANAAAAGRPAAGRSLLSLWEIADPPAELRLGKGAGRTGLCLPRGQRRSLSKTPTRCQRGRIKHLS